MAHADEDPSRDVGDASGKTVRCGQGRHARLAGVPKYTDGGRRAADGGASAARYGCYWCAGATSASASPPTSTTSSGLPASSRRSNRRAEGVT